MTPLSTARYHHHKRQRAKKKDIPMTHPPHTWKKFLDTMMYPIGIIGPLSTIPQIIAIYQTKNVVSVSASTRILLLCLSIPRVVYGFVHKEKKIIFSQIGRIVSYILIIIGVFLYS